jgi:1-acyl-sn-glycerol-3-phosphate acyltransferase
MILVRSLVFQLAFYAVFIVLMLVGLPSMLISRSAIILVVRVWVQCSLWLLATICNAKVEFRGLENLPPGAYIVAPKHQSFLETFALISVIPDFTYILKKELIAIPGFGWWLRATGQIVLDRAKRGSAVADMQKGALEKLAQGRRIIIFPEGTRKPIGAPPAYKIGVAILCEACGLPCVPVALNAGLFWPRHSFLRPPGTVVIEFFPALLFGGDKREFLERLEAIIEPATNALVAQALVENPELLMFQKEMAHAVAEA